MYTCTYKYKFTLIYIYICIHIYIYGGISPPNMMKYVKLLGLRCWNIPVSTLKSLYRQQTFWTTVYEFSQEIRPNRRSRKICWSFGKKIRINKNKHTADTTNLIITWLLGNFRPRFHSPLLQCPCDTGHLGHSYCHIRQPHTQPLITWSKNDPSWFMIFRCWGNSSSGWHTTTAIDLRWWCSGHPWPR